MKRLAFLSLILINLNLVTNTAFGARCDNFHSNLNVHNQNICPFLKAGNSEDPACKQSGPAHCVTKCHEYNISKEDCRANEACMWEQNSIVNPCREKDEGWVPQFDR